ncbi:MAG: alpha/beta fold hydrolase [Patescibacteria group bacterium]|nr:alpha/beta fold hydrolase [Patescibacteria group bacterium]MCL5262024.1 alpha/beta fold hydrolase [Patescibacteria group bacterium]
MRTVIFIHGYNASPEINWYPEMRRELDKLRVPYRMPALPGGDNPKSREWLRIIDETVKSVKGDVVLVGHSLGTRAALLYLDQSKKPVKGVLLVAPFDNNIANAGRRGFGYSDFFEYPLNIGEIKKLSPKFVVMHSHDDQRIPFGQGKRIAKELGADFVAYDGKHHFARPESFADVFAQLKKFL